MISPLRNRFGIPGVISVIALVFAMLGGAYAASNDSGSGKASASAKAKKGPRGPRGPKGPAGPAGPQGPAGPAGAKGDTGAAGAKGSNGAVGATGATGPTGKTGATGASGLTGFTDTLPSGKTEMGSWFAEIGAGGSVTTSISFPIPLAADLEPANTKVVAKAATPPEECDNGTGAAPSPANPEADSGFLCVFVMEGTPPFMQTFKSAGTPPSAGASRPGARIVIAGTPAESVYGTFAVTG